MSDSVRKQSRIVRWIRRFAKWLFWIFLTYVAIILVGLIPVNNGFESTADGVRIYVVSNQVHADIIVPVQTETIDWMTEFDDATFDKDVSFTSHVAFGWGDKGFFLETPAWSDFKISTAANALFLPSESCVHVSFTRPEYYPEAVAVTISNDQYARLVEFTKETFKRTETGDPIHIPGFSYSSTDEFFEANGRYHILNTCNSWVGRGLKNAGVRVPWLSPLPKTPMLYIDEE